MPSVIRPFRALEMTIIVEKEGYRRTNPEYELIVRDRNEQKSDAMVVDRYLFLENPNLTNKTMKAGWMHGDNITPPALRYASSRKWSAETSLSRVKAIAKRESKVSGIPFNPEAEPVSWDDLKYGPWQQCVACQEKWDRTFDKVHVCPACVSHARNVAQESQVKSKTSYTAPSDILPSRLLGEAQGKAGEEYGEKIILALHQLLGLPIDTSYNSNESTIGYVRSSYWTGVYRMTTSEARYIAMRNIVELIREITEKAHAHGSLGAKSLLVGLASGQFSIDEFNDKIVAIEKRRDS